MARDRSRRDNHHAPTSARSARCAAPAATRRRVRPAGATSAGPDPAVVLRAAALDPLRAMITIGVRGSLTIPARLRRALALEPGGRLIAELTPEGVLLRPAITFPRDRCGVGEFRSSIDAEDELERFLCRRRRRTAA
jgi:AbrB family looped-hinge helix DNA binding protein